LAVFVSDGAPNQVAIIRFNTQFATVSTAAIASCLKQEDMVVVRYAFQGSVGGKLMRPYAGKELVVEAGVPMGSTDLQPVFLPAEKPEGSGGGWQVLRVRNPEELPFPAVEAMRAAARKGDAPCGPAWVGRSESDRLVEFHFGKHDLNGGWGSSLELVVANHGAFLEYLVASERRLYADALVKAGASRNEKGLSGLDGIVMRVVLDFAGRWPSLQRATVEKARLPDSRPVGPAASNTPKDEPATTGTPEVLGIGPAPGDSATSPGGAGESQR
jgi:hypothetical protein